MNLRNIAVKWSVLIFLILPSIAFAAPDVSVQANPSEMWLSEGGTAGLLMDFSVEASSPEAFNPDDVIDINSGGFVDYYNEQNDQWYGVDYCFSLTCYFSVNWSNDVTVTFLSRSHYYPEQTVSIGETVSLLYSSMRINSSATVADGDKFKLIEDYSIDYLTGYDNAGATNWTVHIGTAPVVPEPISSILFVTGGTLLAGRRFAKRKKVA